MPFLKVPHILVPLPPLLGHPLHHPLHLMFPWLPLLPVHRSEDPKAALLSPLDHRARAHLVVRLHVVVQVLVTLCREWVLHEGCRVVSSGCWVHGQEFQVEVRSIKGWIGEEGLYCRLRVRMFRIDFFREFWCCSERPAVEGLCELMSWKVVRRSRISRISFTL